MRYDEPLFRPPARPGGKRRMLKVAESAGYVVGVDLGQTHLNMGLCDLEGNVLDIITGEVDLLHETPESILSRVVEAVHSLSWRNALSPEALFSIGAGLVVDGRIYRGAKGAAGGIGHIGAGEEDTLCHCGNRGFLAGRLAEGALITPELVGLGAARGDEECLRLIITTGKTLGDVLAKLVNFSNPSLIVLGGDSPISESAMPLPSGNPSTGARPPSPRRISSSSGRPLERRQASSAQPSLSLTSAESAILAELARRSGLVAAVNYNLRFYPLVHEARELLRAGRLDRTFLVHGAYLQDWLLYDTDWSWRLDPGAGGPLRAVADIGTHWLDMVSFVMGLRVESVMADLATFHEIRQRP